LANSFGYLQRGLFTLADKDLEDFANKPFVVAIRLGLTQRLTKMARLKTIGLMVNACIIISQCVLIKKSLAYAWAET